jgi:transposase
VRTCSDRRSWPTIATRLWHLRNQVFARQPDAKAALAKTCQRLPPWFVVASGVASHSLSATPGRPRKDTAPTRQAWQIQATLTRDRVAREREAQRRAALLVGTNRLDVAAWPDEAVITRYREHSLAERGFTFLNDALVLAASVFVKRPERIMALACIMTLCVLGYKLAKVRVRQHLAATGQSVPDQVGRATARPTLRWLCQCFEGIDRPHTRHLGGTRATKVVRLTTVHRSV